MAGFQQFTAVGRLGQDPELRATATGKAVANFSLAVNTKRGEQEHTEWFRCVAWDKRAELVGEHLRKGREVHITGRLQTRPWTDGDGNDRSTTEVVLSEITFLGRKDPERPARETEGHNDGPAPMTDEDAPV